MKEENTTSQPDNAGSRNGTQDMDTYNALMQQTYGSMYPSSYLQNDMMAMQYSYMYNAYYQQYAHQLAAMQQMHDTTRASSTSANENLNTRRSANPTSTHVDNANYQTKSSSPKDNVRYEPYRRQSTSAPVSPASLNGNSNIVSTSSSSIENLNNINRNQMHSSQFVSWPQPHTRTSSLERLNDKTEVPVDLSQKTQKLQFLNTLKEILDSKTKKETKQNLNDNANGIADKTKQQKAEINPGSDKAIAKHQEQSTGDLENKPVNETSKNNDGPKSITPSDKQDCVTKTLKTTEDKRAYIAVLRELFEKGHSSTSEKILANQSNNTPSSSSQPNNPSTSTTTSVHENPRSDKSVPSPNTNTRTRSNDGTQNFTQMRAAQTSEMTGKLDGKQEEKPAEITNENNGALLNENNVVNGNGQCDNDSDTNEEAEKDFIYL